MRYRLDELGWHQFENLCQSLLKAKFADAIESWGGSRDVGRDAYCSRPIALVKDVPSAAPLVFQVKFVSAANSAGANWKKPLLSAVQKECELLVALSQPKCSAQHLGCIVTLVDRLMHKAEVVFIEGDSYRKKEAVERAEQRAQKKRGKGKKAGGESNAQTSDPS